MSNNLHQLYLTVLTNELQFCYPTLPASSLSITEDEQQLCMLARQLATGGVVITASKGFGYLHASFDNIIFELNRKPFEYVPKQLGFAARELQFTTSFFPQAIETQDKDALQKRWSEIQTAISNVTSSTPTLSSIDTFLYQLERFASLLPNNLVIDEDNPYAPDISLYDHVRSVAAFAICLALYKEAKGISVQQLKDDHSQEAFLLVAGDTSGIQHFIYDIIGAKASRNLKGRSFYIQLLNESVLFQLLSVQGFSRAHLVYSSGGNFYALLPNTEKVNAYIKTIKQDFVASLFKTHKTQLFFALTAHPFSTKDLLEAEDNSPEPNGFKKVWKESTATLKKAKRQRYTESFQTNFESLFRPIEQGGTKPRDAITNEEFTEEELKELGQELDHPDRHFIHYLSEGKKENGQEGTPPDKDKAIRLLTNSQILLGKLLGKADYYITTSASVEKFTSDRLSFQNEFSIGTFPVYHYLIAAEEIQDFLAALSTYQGQVRILKFNNTDFYNAIIPSTITQGFMLYGGNRFPTYPESGYAKNFEDLAGTSQLKRLGVLRMDVDSLGQIFISGTKHKAKNFAAYSSLSRSLDMFFKGQLNLIWQEDQFRDDTYILYSGGDDLFLLGRWDKVLAFGKRIKEDFQRWTGNNPSLTISGGMVMVGGKFPISQSADMAEIALDIAKNYTYTYATDTDDIVISKSAIQFLDHTFNWEEEFTKLEELQTQWLRLVEEKGTNEEGKDFNPPLSRAIFGKVSELRQLQAKQTDQHLNPTWLWLSTYHFSQTISRIRHNHPKALEAKNFLEAAKKDIAGNTYQNTKLNDHFTFLELLHLAARWAEFEIRTNSGQETEGEHS